MLEVQAQAKPANMFWLYVATVVVVVVGAVVLLFKREVKRVEGKLKNSDDAKEELLGDIRARAVKRIVELNDLRKSPSKLRLALKRYFKKRRQYRKVVAKSNREKGDGMRSLYVPQQEVHSSPEPLNRSTTATASSSHAQDIANERALLKQQNQKFALNALKREFNFLNREELVALSFDATETKLSAGQLLVTQGALIATPSLYIVKTGLLECTCDGVCTTNLSTD